MAYGIKIPMAADDYVWIIDLEASDPSFNPSPLLFEDKESALKACSIWKLAKVEKYEDFDK